LNKKSHKKKIIFDDKFDFLIDSEIKALIEKMLKEKGSNITFTEYIRNLIIKDLRKNKLFP
jgi:hypothetical protein